MVESQEGLKHVEVTLDEDFNVTSFVESQKGLKRDVPQGVAWRLLMSPVESQEELKRIRRHRTKDKM
jgi:hypothetical protein